MVLITCCGGNRALLQTRIVDGMSDVAFGKLHLTDSFC